MQIGNMNIPINLNGIGSGIMTGLFVIGILLILGVGAWMFWSWYKKKITFNVPVKLIKYLENGTKKELNGLLGGKQLVGGVQSFMIMMPKQRKPFNLGYMPNFSLADADNKLAFITSGDGTLWQQIKEELVTKEIIEVIDEQETKKIEISLLLKPIPTEIKTKTINDMLGWRAILDKNKLSAWTITIVGFVIMVIAHLISLYIQTKIKCGVPAP
jgi:hypothetical protein